MPIEFGKRKHWHYSHFSGWLSNGFLSISTARRPLLCYIFWCHGYDFTERGQGGEKDQLIFSCTRATEMNLRLREGSWPWRESSGHPSSLCTIGKLSTLNNLHQPPYFWEEGMVWWCLQLSDDPWHWNRGLHSPCFILGKTIFKVELAGIIIPTFCMRNQTIYSLPSWYNPTLTTLWSKGHLSCLIFIWVSDQPLNYHGQKRILISSFQCLLGLPTLVNDPTLFKVILCPAPTLTPNSHRFNSLASWLSATYKIGAEMVHFPALSLLLPLPGCCQLTLKVL